MAKFISAQVVSNKLFASGHYILQARPQQQLGFSAGQFTRLGLRLGDEVVARAYSFVNPPEAELLEFYSIVVPEGELSAKLSQLQVGSELLVADKPSGFLTAEETPAGGDLWLLATGTGVGPFVSLLRAGAVLQSFERVIITHAVRHSADLHYHQELLAYAQANPKLSYLPFVSREQFDEALSGRIPQALAAGKMQERAGVELTPERSRVLLCGNPQMVSDSLAQLEQMGLKRHRRRDPGQILMEKYWS